MYYLGLLSRYSSPDLKYFCLAFQEKGCRPQLSLGFGLAGCDPNAPTWLSGGLEKKPHGATPSCLCPVSPGTEH